MAHVSASIWPLIIFQFFIYFSIFIPVYYEIGSYFPRFLPLTPLIRIVFFSKFFKTVSFIHSILVLSDEVSLAGWWALRILFLTLPLHNAEIKEFGWHIWLLTNYIGSISNYFYWQKNIYILQIKISPKPQNQKFIFLIKKFYYAFLNHLDK